MKNIVIIGAGDLGKEVVWMIEDINKRKPTYLIMGFLDDDVEKTGNIHFKFSTFLIFPRNISRPKVCISHFP